MTFKNKLGILVWKNKPIFFCFADRALAWQQKAQKCLKNDEVSSELKKLSNEIVKESNKKEQMDESDDTEDTDTETDNSATKLAVGKKLPEVKISNKMQNVLEDLLLEGDLLETNMDECHQIWKLLQVSTCEL